MNDTSMKSATFVGLFAFVLMFIGMWPLMHMLPPLDPAMTTAQVADHYRMNATGTILGGILVLLASVLAMPFFGVTAVFMKKIEGEHAPWTYAFIGLAGFAFVTFFLCGLGFILAAYRPEASDETIRSISDFSILMLVLPDLTFSGLAFFVGAAIFADVRAQPVFPRWVGYFQFFVGVVNLPGGVVALFKAGPFDWNGPLGFWVPVVGFGIWVNVMLWAIFDALKRKVLYTA